MDEHQEPNAPARDARSETALDDWEREVAESEAALRKARRELRLAEEEHAFDREQLTASRRRLIEQQQEAQAARERLDDERAEMRRQRRRIARALRLRRAAQLDDLARRHAELMALADQAPRPAEPAPGTTALSAEANELKREVVRLNGLLDGHATDLDHAQAEIERLVQEAQQVGDEQDRLSQSLAIEEQRQAIVETKVQEQDYLNRRLELAMEDMRVLQRRNTELEERLKSQGGGAAATHSGWDWEAQKRRLLETLEEEGDADTPERRQERMSIEETLRMTDAIVAQRDEQIAVLRKQLEEGAPSTTPNSAAIAAAAELLNNDEIIQQEREKLERLQVEWHEKLRQSEIQLAVDRARLTRQQAEINEKLQLLQAHDDKQHQAEQADPTAHGDEKPNRSRWLSKLGLKDHPS